MADLSPVETLRAAAAELHDNPEWAYDVVKDVAEPLADWLAASAEDLGWYIAAWDHPHPQGPLVGCASGDPVRLAQLTEERFGKALRVARVLLGVPNA